jgi:hypothetical protein
MASERDFELLDDYIGNRLSEGERESFEGKLQADPELQRELKIQQGIVESLRKARASELKALLNNVPLSAIPSETSSLAKWSGVAVALMVAVGLYFYLRPADETPVPPATDTVSTIPPVSENSPEPESIPAEQLVEEKQPSEDSPSVNGVTRNKKPSIKEQAAETVKSPEMNVYQPEDDAKTENESKAPVAEGDAPEEDFAPSDLTAEIVNNSKSYNFHYQFKDERLILYGAFDKNLYEIMEFISDNKRTIFLHYKNNFYLLNQSGEKVKPLSPINDPVLIQKLKERRSQE